MRKQLIAAASVLALTTGAALAQTSGTTGQGGMNQGTTTMPSTQAPAAQTPSATPSPSAPGAGTVTTTEEALSKGDNVRVERLLGKTVVGSDGEDIGEVEDVILDAQSGGAKQLVVSSGGFLGIGEKQIAIEYDDITFDNENDDVKVSNLTRQDVDGMTEYEYSEGTTSLNRSGGTRSEPMAAPGAAPGAGGTTTTPNAGQ